MEQTAAKIAAGDLSQRIEDYNPSNEIGNLAVSLNTMLTQIEMLFKAREKSEAKMRRFVGDASHELAPLWSVFEATRSCTVRARYRPMRLSLPQ